MMCTWLCSAAGYPKEYSFCSAGLAGGFSFTHHAATFPEPVSDWIHSHFESSTPCEFSLNEILINEKVVHFVGRAPFLHQPAHNKVPVTNSAS